MKMWLKRGACSVGIIFCSGLLIIGWVEKSLLIYQASTERLPESSIPAIVLGASVKLDGTPSDVLIDRVTVAVELYAQKKVGWILMTGDDGKFHTDEVSSMKALAMNLGVPESDIKTDGHGYRTYESCKRAHDEFGITRAVVVTQSFHLGRTLYLCRALGVQAMGVRADLQRYKKGRYFLARDILASIKAWVDINLHSPTSPVEYNN